jgi:ATP-dependent DNA helicase RecG
MMTAFNTPEQLTALLEQLLNLPAENECVEFKGAGDDFRFEKLGKYFSALSNEANLKQKSSAWLLFGVNDKQQVIGTEYCRHRAKLDKLKLDVALKTNNQLSFTEIHELHHPQGRVLLFEIPPALKGMPTAWDGHYYGRQGESLTSLNIAKIEQIREQTLDDWSAQICETATLDDLDPRAIAYARERFKQKNPEQPVDTWDDRVFLNKAKITISDKITNAAILLLGKPESSHFLSPAQAQIIWVLKNERNIEKDYQHFGCPFLLNTEPLFAKIRNLTYRYMGDNTLFPTEISQYDAWVIRELLHNCIAHQDYRLNGRINVVEQNDELLFTNLGHFIPSSIEAVIAADSPPDQYRNPFLAQAMVGLQMIDTMGSGLKKAFSIQWERCFPMPDYDLSDPQRVKVKLFGKILDENYTRALIQHTSLDLLEVIALDKVQKGQNVTEAEAKLLRKKGLVEGKRPNLSVAAKIAEITGTQAAYIRNLELDKEHYKELVLKYLSKFSQASSKQIEELLLSKMPDLLTREQKEHKIKNLLQEMSKKDKTICNVGSRGKYAKWQNV